MNPQQANNFFMDNYNFILRRNPENDIRNNIRENLRFFVDNAPTYYQHITAPSLIMGTLIQRSDRFGLPRTQLATMIRDMDIPDVNQNILEQIKLDFIRMINPA